MDGCISSPSGSVSGRRSNMADSSIGMVNSAQFGGDGSIMGPNAGAAIGIIAAQNAAQ